MRYSLSVAPCCSMNIGCMWISSPSTGHEVLLNDQSTCFGYNFRHCTIKIGFLFFHLIRPTILPFCSSYFFHFSFIFSVPLFQPPFIPICVFCSSIFKDIFPFKRTLAAINRSIIDDVNRKLAEEAGRKRIVPFMLLPIMDKEQLELVMPSFTRAKMINPAYFNVKSSSTPWRPK